MARVANSQHRHGGGSTGQPGGNHLRVGAGADLVQFHRTGIQEVFARWRKNFRHYILLRDAIVYRPLVSEKDCVDAASESFLERVFGGSPKPMLAHFVEHKGLSADELHELRRLLDGEAGV